MNTFTSLQKAQALHEPALFVRPNRGAAIVIGAVMLCATERDEPDLCMSRSFVNIEYLVNVNTQPEFISFPVAHCAEL